MAKTDSYKRLATYEKCESDYRVVASMVVLRVVIPQWFTLGVATCCQS